MTWIRRYEVKAGPEKAAIVIVDGAGFFHARSSYYGTFSYQWQNDDIIGFLDEMQHAHDYFCKKIEGTHRPSERCKAFAREVLPQVVERLKSEGDL